MRNGLPGATLALICLAPLVASSGAEAGQALSGGSSDSDTNGPDRYTFRTRVDMVSLSVTVADRDRRLISDLTEDDFAIYEDGVKQAVVAFSRENLPLRMVILLDTSYSMFMKMPLAQEAAIRFVRSLKPEDRFKVVEFNDRVMTLVDFTSDLQQVTDAIRRTSPAGATSLYNALYISLRGLARERDGVERQAIVVLSDGADTRSLVSFDNVLELAQETDVLIYTISLRGSPDDLEKQKYSNAKYELEELASETGAVSYSPESIGDLAGVYERIATELKSQYNLGYVSSRGVADGRWRTLQILCDYPNARVRTRSGYFARRARARSSGRN